jgi:hypothetical protein
MPNLHYRQSDPTDLRDIPQSLLAEWAAAANPKFAEWLPAPAKPADNAAWNAGEWVIPQPPATTAEEHLGQQGYTPLRLLTCLDLEAKLRATGKASPKLAAVREWLDSLTLAAAANPDNARPDWPSAPFPFDAVVQEAITQLIIVA